MTKKGKLGHKLHQLQKRVSRALENEGVKKSLKTSLRINRIQKIKKKINKEAS